VPAEVNNQPDAAQTRLIRRLTWRIIPFLGVLYVVSYLDRVNVGFAALTMNSDLRISPRVFGLGGGIFFMGYLLFQVPSNLLLERFGARRWLTVIVLAWGIVSVSTGLIQSAHEFLIARFVLGLAEAGFFPGVVLYLTYWFPKEYRGRIMSGLMLAVPMATILGAPLSSVILSAFHDPTGQQGWRWLFYIEGAPALVGAIAVLLLLPDKPETVSWLSESERQWLISATRPAIDVHVLKRANTIGMLNHPVLLYAIVYFGLALSLYGVGLWLPQMIKASGVSIFQAAMLSAVPYVVAAIGMLIWGRVADARGQVGSNVWIPTVVAALALATLPLAANVELQLGLLSATALGTLAALANFWTISTTRLPARNMAAGVAIINSVGNLGGFLGPFMVGWLKQATNSYSAGVLFLSAWVAGSALLLFASTGIRSSSSGHSA
jgi:ACS family tartrate transporter-like MFS transporter